MQKLAMVGLAVLVVFAFACSTAHETGKMECKGCHMMADKTCPKDGMCAHCDKCTMKCEGCKQEVKAMDMCPKCQKMCLKCDTCAK
jgi:hypothetical protein